MSAARMAHTGETLVEAGGLGVRRGGRWLVRGIDLAVRRGEIVTLIGPNGGGKSTSAKALLGIVKPDEGEVRRKPGLTVGYVPQRLAIDWTMPLTVSRFMSLTNSFGRQEIAAALAETGVAHLARAPLQGLSGGEFQRVLIARAIATRPDLLVLDEPVQGVDFTGEVAVYRLIGEIRERLSCGILLISHDLHLVMAETDRVVCLNGHVCCSGSPELVAASESYRRLFGPRAAETLAVYRHHHGHSHDIHGDVVPLPARTAEGSAGEPHGERAGDEVTGEKRHA
ncbi:zinc ABC transporter ATP-binding protein ZnuC [Afifella sp. IM 167]|uniref:zinc ABC transporter ATP-binding protein ZnuC n=1 Tax=Afifella sp. IM 167 TaxID=2033586 RepID=UPI002714AC1F|nr:zinc ABC transporter ATP-binding protein ZnuC [Afifella sp. IM 167]